MKPTQIQFFTSGIGLPPGSIQKLVIVEPGPGGYGSKDSFTMSGIFCSTDWIYDELSALKCEQYIFAVITDKMEHVSIRIKGDSLFLTHGFYVPEEAMYKFAFQFEYSITSEPRPVFDHMTPTAEKLIGSPSFWIKRIEQQVEYIARFDNVERTNPDATKVKFNAIDILEMCQRNAIIAAISPFEKGIVSQIISDIGAPTNTHQKKGGTMTLR